MKNEQVSLFADTAKSPRRKSRAEVFNDYDGFVRKHENAQKRTTDDCYTPQAVYDVVLEFASRLTDISGRRVVRPFYPDGDYQHADYSDGCVVIDNPPFSIFTQIVRWYEQRGISYFLFAPAITIFQAQATCSILADADVVYENGATVKTSFVTNLIDDPRVWLCPELKRRLNAIGGISIHPTEKKHFPPQVANAAQLGKFLSRGIEVKMPKRECAYIGNYVNGQKLFGCGIAMSDRLTDMLRQYQLQFERDVELTEREKEIIEQLNKSRL